MLGTDTDITSLKKAEEDLQFANTLLTTQMETSPDAILVVDANAKIISFNRRFSEMWNVPLGVLRAETDAPVLAAVTSAMADPDAFVARVKYLYAHPEAEGHDRLDTKDGRVIDRNTGVLQTPDRPISRRASGSSATSPRRPATRRSASCSASASRRRSTT